MDSSGSNPDSGFAHIKPEFIHNSHQRTLVTECLTKEDKDRLHEKRERKENDDEQAEKQQKLNNGQKKKLKGQNKARPCTYKCAREQELCSSLVDLIEGEVERACSNQRCQFMHSIPEYLKLKPADVGSACYLFSVRGRCPRGVTCRFGNEHISPHGRNIVQTELWQKFQTSSDVSKTINSLSRELQHALRKKKYNFINTENVVNKFFKSRNKTRELRSGNGIESEETLASENVENTVVEPSVAEDTKETEYSNTTLVSTLVSTSKSESFENTEMKDNVQLGPEGDTVQYKTDDVSKCSGCVTDEDVIFIRPEERRQIPVKNCVFVQIDWQRKLYLAPLTTVGNLPFRRVCREFGAEVTCGEMALATSLLQGGNQEWALVKRHSSETLFGVQLCGNNPHVMTRCAQMLQEQICIDFIDINLGCPIDLIYQQGAGSGLLRRERVLESVVTCMKKVLNLPLTVKLRTGVYSDKNIAHVLAPRFRDWGASLVTVHGRSREQRYTRHADWGYVEQCAQAASPVPLFGSGDVISYEDYERFLDVAPTAAGAMIGRGALIKPWIFTEICERRHWDISSSERLDILRRYVNYGLEHWGSDTKGVENTRRFLLEWLSFLHRYIPVGVLEHPPQRMNQRPPYYNGRDDLETLMASSNCADWIRISEMLLGPVPEGFQFLPKHKANSWK